MHLGWWWAVVSAAVTARVPGARGEWEQLRCGIVSDLGQPELTCTDRDRDGDGEEDTICCGYRVSECVSSGNTIGLFLGIEWSCRRSTFKSSSAVEVGDGDEANGGDGGGDEGGLAVTKRVKEDYELAAVPWQTLWLLQSSKQECDFQEAVLRSDSLGANLESSEWLLMPNRLEDAIGHCPVRFRSHVDPHRWLPRNLVVSECLCEGTPCAKNGLHVCVTAFATRTVFSLYTGKKRILLAVGCICAIQKTRLAQVIKPQTVD